LIDIGVSEQLPQAVGDVQLLTVELELELLEDVITLLHETVIAGVPTQVLLQTVQPVVGGQGDNGAVIVIWQAPSSVGIKVLNIQP